MSALLTGGTMAWLSYRACSQAGGTIVSYGLGEMQITTIVVKAWGICESANKSYTGCKGKGTSIVPQRS